MRKFLLLLVLVALTAAAVFSGRSSANERIAKDTGRSCTTCHDKPGSKLLTDAGMYFESQRSLEGYEVVTEGFGKCTNCHARKPGSRKFTARGRQFSGLVKDMPELRQWMKEGHPIPASH